MNFLATLFDGGLLQAEAERDMGWVLVHSLWQISLLAGVYAALMTIVAKSVSGNSIPRRLCYLLVMLGLPMGTYVLLPPGRSRRQRTLAWSALPDVAMRPLKIPAGESNPVEADSPAVEPHVVPLDSVARESDASPATGGRLLEAFSRRCLPIYRGRRLFGWPGSCCSRYGPSGVGCMCSGCGVTACRCFRKR